MKSEFVIQPRGKILRFAPSFNGGVICHLMSQMLKGWTAKQLKIHFGEYLFVGDYGPVIQSVAVVFVFWLVCLWLYRQRVFLRI